MTHEAYDRLSVNDFKRLSAFIQSTIGIKMPESKRGMVESRLRKRLRALSVNTYSGYCDYLFSKDGMARELTSFIDMITTNKTDFFREPNHFTYLTESVVPDLMAKRGAGTRRKLKVWSAACSRGDEPYTLAMVLSGVAAGLRGGGFDFSILATDISTRMLETAKTAVYDEEFIEPVSPPLRKKYFLRSKDRRKALVRVVPELRNRVAFRRLNLLDENYRLPEKMDVIFCRNVFIYFERKTQQEILRRFCRQMTPGSYLFMGHSEVMDCKDLPLVPVGHTTYRMVAKKT